MAESVTIDDKYYDDLIGIESRLDETIRVAKANPTTSQEQVEIKELTIKVLEYVKTGVKK